ncbi:hypothetical protein E3N88_29847 [Mikania micrantha]|uniref:RNA helicase n=1 Tax=Mikania micrantha TaxID=192012 RepID=A0A5N6MMU7_9ASTR|nr:hypothetical protein E3N88_29847 [Mikania micrantha]
MIHLHLSLTHHHKNHRCSRPQSLRCWMTFAARHSNGYMFSLFAPLLPILIGSLAAQSSPDFLLIVLKDLLPHLRDLRLITHVFADEIHERGMYEDLLIVLKDLLRCHRDRRLTNATMNAELFSNYFDGAPMIHIIEDTHPLYGELAAQNEENVLTRGNNRLHLRSRMHTTTHILE